MGCVGDIRQGCTWEGSVLVSRMLYCEDASKTAARAICSALTVWTEKLMM
jgi:hypothetical protein